MSVAIHVVHHELKMSAGKAIASLSCWAEFEALVRAFMLSNKWMLNEKDQVIEQKDQALEQHREALEQKDQALGYKDIELEMKDKEVEDLQRHIRSLMAELDKRRLGLPLSDDEDISSASSSDTERRSSSMSQSSSSSSSPSDSDSESSPLEEFPVASCKVCLVKPSQIVFLPCKHLCCCERCAARLHGKNCPICREQNLGYEKVYVI